MDFPIFKKEYEDSLEWLFSRLPMFSRIGAAAYKPGLENTQELDRIFGHPHKRFRSIHVAGTNGKGSTSHMLAAVLQAQGYKTGLYTSPHLIDFRERMRIDGKMIPKEKVITFIQSWKSKETSLTPSFFELTMMMAFDWFASENIDIAVIETGMGGRLDSTNIINPMVSIITNISFDHTQFLGSTLDKIAKEKAGIIKKDVPVIIGEANPSIRKIFIEKASETGSHVVFAEEWGKEIELEHGVEGWSINLENESIMVPLSGNYQKYNIRTVLCAISQLNSLGLTIDENAVKKGLTNVTELTGFKGRWQKVGERPTVICDTGHNEAGIKEAMATLTTLYKEKKKIFIIGFVNDKEIKKIVGLFPKNATYHFTQPSIPRAKKAFETAQIFNEEGITGSVHENVASAFEAALRGAGNEDLIYIGGSTFVVADFLSNLQKALKLKKGNG